MEKIFVSVASYRDKLCDKTVRNLFQMAEHPNRVFVGICQQNHKDDPDCIGSDVDKDFKKNIRILRISYKKAKGPTLARYYCSKLYRGEEFYMQIDSHSLFVRHWDTHAIDMVKRVEAAGLSKKVVLSHYPPEYKDYKETASGKELITTITTPFFNEQGMISFHGAEFKKPGVLPRRNAFVAAGFFFARGALVSEVPFDPFLPHLFTGEEILLSARFYTHGWDVFTPNKNILFHSYTREGEPKFWNDHHAADDDSSAKAKMITGLVAKDLEKIKDLSVRRSVDAFGLGGYRTLDDFYRFIGVDIVNKKVGKPMVEFYCGCVRPSREERRDLPLVLMYQVGLLVLVLIVSVYLIFAAESI